MTSYGIGVMLADMATLREEIKPLSGNRRKFFLLRIADMDTAMALKLVGVVKGTYNSWLQDQEFVTLYRQVKDFAVQYKQEAVQLLRRDNQLDAVLLERDIIKKLKEELESGDYNLLRSQLAREVYSKLMSDLDVVPAVQVQTWEQRIGSIINNNAPEQVEGDRKVISIDGNYKEVSQSEAEHSQGQLCPVSKEGGSELKETPEEEVNDDPS